MNFPEFCLAILSVQHNMCCISELIRPSQYEVNSNKVWKVLLLEAVRLYLVSTMKEIAKIQHTGQGCSGNIDFGG